MIVRKKVLLLVAATVVASVVGYWILSGFSMSGDSTYDLMTSGSSPTRQRSWRQKAGQFILPLIYSHDTRYAQRYREEAFDAVQAGASRDEVRAALGEPLDERQLDDGRWMWHYSKPGPESQDFLVRVVEFDRSGRVVRKHAEFYVD